MLVSHQHKFIYTKTVKTASTSVEAYLQPFCSDPPATGGTGRQVEHVSKAGIIGFRGRERPTGCKWYDHMPAFVIKRRLGQSIWDSYCKFCVIRNPFDKVISYFFFIRAQLPQLVDQSRSDREAFERWVSPAALASFNGFDRDKYIIADNFCLDAVLRYEHLEHDLGKVCQRLGLPWNPDALPRLQSGKRPSIATISSMYSRRSAEVVRRFYDFEFNFFGYSDRIDHYCADAPALH